MKKPGPPRAVLLALLLGGCSGGGGGAGDGGHGAPAPNAFVAAVQTLVATSSDDADPIDPDSVALTAPDTTDPLPLH